MYRLGRKGLSLPYSRGLGSAFLSTSQSSDSADLINVSNSEHSHMGTGVDLTVNSSYAGKSAYINDDGGNARYGTGNFDTTLVTAMQLSVWIRMDATGLPNYKFHEYTTNIGMQFYFTNTQLRVGLKDTGTNTAVEVRWNTTWTADVWHHVLVGIDTTQATAALGCDFWHDGVDEGDPDTVTTYTQNNDFNLDGNFGDVTANNLKETYWGELWIDTGTARTIDSAFVGKFIDGDGKPVDLGATGQLPTGSQPKSCYTTTTNKAALYLDKGSLGNDLTEVGTAFAEGVDISSAGSA